MSISWSFMIFMFNMYILFTILFHFAIGALPKDGILFFEIAMETILVTEVLLRLGLKKFAPESYDNLNLMHVIKDDSYKVYALIMIGSIPWITIYSAISNPSDSVTAVFSRIASMKLLRCFEIWRILSRVEEVLFYKKFKTLVVVKFAKNIVYVLMITHFVTCLWILVEETHQSSP